MHRYIFFIFLSFNAHSLYPFCYILVIFNSIFSFQRLASHLYMIKQRPYIINLDPAVHELSYPANIDIRDTVKYKEVMKQYNLGPNGGIMTSLNLFATKFDQVLDLLDKRSSDYKYVFICMRLYYKKIIRFLMKCTSRHE